MANIASTRRAPAYVYVLDVVSIIKAMVQCEKDLLEKERKTPVTSVTLDDEFIDFCLKSTLKDSWDVTINGIYTGVPADKVADFEQGCDRLYTTLIDALNQEKPSIEHMTEFAGVLHNRSAFGHYFDVDYYRHGNTVFLICSHDPMEDETTTEKPNDSTDPS